MEDEKDAIDILLDKIEMLEKKIAGKDEKNTVDIDKAKKEAEEKDKKAVNDKLKEKMKNRGLL